MPSFDELAEALGGEEDRERGGLERLAPEGRRSVQEECRRLRAWLEHNHVFYQNAEAGGLARLVADPSSSVSKILRSGFHRLVLFDAARGLERGKFDLERFLRHAQARMAEAFRLDLPPDSFHAENVVQVLKDEPRSLLCFLNVQLVPIEGMRHLRGFTQEKHQTLFLCQGQRDLGDEERHIEDSDSDSELVFDLEDAGLSVEPEPAAPPPDWRDASDVRTLYKQLVAEVLRALPAERAAVAEVKGPRARVRATAASPDAGPACYERLPKVIAQCMAEQRALAGSIKVKGVVRWVMVAPLALPGEPPTGVVYAERGEGRRRFSRPQLKVLAELGKQAAVRRVVVLRQRRRDGDLGSA